MTEKISTKFQNIKEIINQINEKPAVINDIAYKTELLFLNVFIKKWP